MRYDTAADRARQDRWDAFWTFLVLLFLASLTAL